MWTHMNQIWIHLQLILLSISLFAFLPSRVNLQLHCNQRNADICGHTLVNLKTGVGLIKSNLYISMGLRSVFTFMLNKVSITDHFLKCLFKLLLKNISADRFWSQDTCNLSQNDAILHLHNSDVTWLNTQNDFILEINSTCHD